MKCRTDHPCTVEDENKIQEKKSDEKLLQSILPVWHHGRCTYGAGAAFVFPWDIGSVYSRP